MFRLFREFVSDLAFGARQARKNPGLAVLSLAVLGVGVGSTTAAFTVLYDAVLKPLAYGDPSQLVLIHNEFPKSVMGQTPVSGPDYVDLSRHPELFSETAAYYFDDFTLTGAGQPQHVDAIDASASLFPLLGTPPALGLYGTLAQLVQLRRREIAIRMVLGASAGDARALILRQGALLLLAGLGPGNLLAWAGAHALRALLFGIPPFDPWTVSLTASGFFLLALCASSIAALQATRVHPLVALHEE